MSLRRAALVLGGLELGLRARAARPGGGGVSVGGPLGYGPPPGEEGFRKTPPLPRGTPAVLFFGDSFAFGEGVGEEEAFPAVFQRASGLKTIDLAYRGYGPHQMLRLLELGLEKPAAARYRPVLAFYVFIPAHVARAAGKAFWDPDGPRYELDSGGRARYDGPWRGARAAGLIRLLSRSALARALWRPWLALDGDEADVARLVAIVAESHSIFRERYGGELMVLAWDGRWSRDRTRRIAGLLRARGVPVVLLADALPDLDRRELYLPDGHPGPALHGEVGLCLARGVKGSAPGWTCAAH